MLFINITLPGEQYSVGQVIIINRLDNCCLDHLDGTDVFLLLHSTRVGSCGSISVTSNSTAVSDQTYNMICGGTLADSVKIEHLDTSNPLNIAEVIVQGTGEIFNMTFF